MGILNRVTGIRLAVASLLVGLVVAGCGSGTPTATSPAPLAPTNSLVYLELTVRPQGSQRADAETALTKLLGHSPDGTLQQAASKLLGHVGLSYGQDVAPWLGQKVGVVVTSAGHSPLGVIAPTENTSAALRTLKKGLGAGASRSYSGVHYELGAIRQTPVAVGIVGENAVIAAPSVFRGIVNAYHGRSLAQTQSFASAFASLPPGALIKGYVNGAGLSSLVRHKLAAWPAATAGAAPVRQYLTGTLGALKGAFGFSFSATPKALSIDVRSTTTHPGPAADVSSLPGDSWLAIASNFRPNGITSLLTSLAHNPALEAGLSSFKSHVGLDLLHDVLPALGPFELSLQGTSALSLGVGLVLHPSDAAAAGRVLTAIRKKVAQGTSFVVHGNNHLFTVTKPGLPIPRIGVSQSRGRVVATVDQSFKQFLSPSSRLASNPSYASALSQLPAGSKVPVYINFSSLSTLLGSLKGFISSASDQKALGAVGRLSYLIVGSNPATGQGRLVLGLR